MNQHRKNILFEGFFSPSFGFQVGYRRRSGFWVSGF
ncbi:hypothetical protein I3760_16G096600 [Carya illinoinensis]|nr:hypothetical protein I3760_16G096600 [Carya illinoinensis]